MNYLSRKQSGFALLAVLWISAILISIVAVIGSTSRMDSFLVRNSSDRIKMKWAARAALEQFCMLLNEDEDGYDGISDLWYSTAENPSSYYSTDMAGCTVSVTTIDPASRFNINTITDEYLKRITILDEQMVNSILDWKDEDSDVRAGGAEDPYYMNLKPPYHASNSNFHSLRELAAVKGITLDNISGTDSPDGKNLSQYLSCWSGCYSSDPHALTSAVNINQASADDMEISLGLSPEQARWIENRRRNNQFNSIVDLIDQNTPTSSSNNNADSGVIDIETFCMIADSIKVNDENEPFYGRINLNTATREVLQLLLNGDEMAAQSVFAGQSTGYTGIADILSLGYVDVAQYKRIYNMITIRSDILRFKCVVTSENTKARYQIEAVVSRLASPAEVLYYYAN